VLIGRDAERHGRNGWMWGVLFIFSPLVFGIAYLLIRRTTSRPPCPDSPLGGTDRTSVYRMAKWWPAQITATIALFSAIAGFLVWTSATGAAGLGWVFTSVWLLALGFTGYGFLWRLVYQLELLDDVIRWKTPCRSGSVRLTDIREFHPWLWGRNAEAIDLMDGRRLLVLLRKGFTSFVADVKQKAPNLPIQVGRYAAIVEWWPGTGSGYNRED
jgi:hypothetical protein